MKKQDEVVILVLWAVVIVLILRWLSSRSARAGQPKTVIDRGALVGIDDVASAPSAGVWNWGTTPDEQREVLDPAFLEGVADVASWGR